MKTIKKYQAGGKVADKTATKKPTIRKEMQEQPSYKYMIGKNTKQDSTDYKEGFGIGRRDRNPSMFSPLSRTLGGMEGQEKKPFVKPKAKSGAKVTKKGGMKAFEKTAFDKKADKPGGRHGKEGSKKDIKMDKIDAKKQGFIKKSGGKIKK